MVGFRHIASRGAPAPSESSERFNLPFKERRDTDTEIRSGVAAAGVGNTQYLTVELAKSNGIAEVIAI